MNIHLYTHSAHVEGAPIMLTRLAHKLQQRGHTCRMILTENGLLEQRLQQYNVPYTVYEGIGMFRDIRPDLVIANTILSFHIVEECKQRRIPVVWIIRESDMVFMEMGVKPEHFAMADAVVFPSHFTKALYAKFDTGNFHVIHNGIDVEEVQRFRESHSKEQLREHYCIPQDASVFLSVGTYQPLKGFNAFVESALQMMKRHPDKNVHCITAGRVPSPKDQDYANRILRRAWGHDLRHRVHMFADFPLIYELYALSDYYVCASSLETFPGTVLEAMAFELPIIASDVGGIPEQITHETHGFLVAPQEVTPMRDAMHALLTDPEGAMQMGQNGFEKCTGMFTSERMCTEYEALFDEMNIEKTVMPPVNVQYINGQPSLSLIMRASKPGTIKDALEAAIGLFPHYTECVVAVSPDLPNDTLDFLQRIPRVRIIEGTNVRENAGDLHYRLLDQCTGEWIVNVDDDDLWMWAPDIHAMPRDAGLVYGQYLYCNYYLPAEDPRRFVIEKGKEITVPEDANGVRGSNWIMRNAAWKTITHTLENRSFRHSDWRMYYALVKGGWKMHYVDRVFGIERRFAYLFPSTPGTEWKDTVASMV